MTSTSSKLPACPESGAARQDARLPLRAVFMGTPAFAADILRRVLTRDTLRVIAAYTQPDRPAGRGKALKEPEVKTLAREHGIPIYQPANFRDDADIAALAALQPDLLLVAAYGLLLPQRVLDIPRLMPVNVHASLLPRYRGAAPIQRAVMDGERFTGITIMRMESRLDAGPILLQRAVGIDINDTSATLHDELAREGGELLADALTRLARGTLHEIPQDDSLATYAAKLTKIEGEVDFSLDTRRLHARIRGVTPWPGAFAVLRRPGLEDMTVSLEPGPFPLPQKMLEAGQAALRDSTGAMFPGTVVRVVENVLLVACADGCYAFSSLRPAGKKAMDGRAFYNGYLKDIREAGFVRQTSGA